MKLYHLETMVTLYLLIMKYTLLHTKKVFFFLDKFNVHVIFPLVLDL